MKPVQKKDYTIVEAHKVSAEGYKPFEGVKVNVARYQQVNEYRASQAMENVQNAQNDYRRGQALDSKCTGTSRDCSRKAAYIASGVHNPMYWVIIDLGQDCALEKLLIRNSYQAAYYSGVEKYQIDTASDHVLIDHAITDGTTSGSTTKYHRRGNHKYTTRKDLDPTYITGTMTADGINEQESIWQSSCLQCYPVNRKARYVRLTFLAYGISSPGMDYLEVHAKCDSQAVNNCDRGSCFDNVDTTPCIDSPRKPYWAGSGDWREFPYDGCIQTTTATDGGPATTGATNAPTVAPTNAPSEAPTPAPTFCFRDPRI